MCARGELSALHLEFLGNTDTGNNSEVVFRLRLVIPRGVLLLG